MIYFPIPRSPAVFCPYVKWLNNVTNRCHLADHFYALTWILLPSVLSRIISPSKCPRYSRNYYNLKEIKRKGQNFK